MNSDGTRVAATYSSTYATIPRLGELMPGANADLLVVDGAPYKDIALFLDPDRRIPAIMAGGRFVRNQLAA